MDFLKEDRHLMTSEKNVSPICTVDQRDILPMLPLVNFSKCILDSCFFTVDHFYLQKIGSLSKRERERMREITHMFCRTKIVL